MRAVALAFVLLAWPSSALAAETTLFSGQATVVDGTVAGVPITLVDTGPVAPEGGELEQSLLCYPNTDDPDCLLEPLPDLTDGAVRARVLHAAVVAHGNKSSAEASVADFGVSAAGVSIEAEFLAAEAEAKCTDGAASISGHAEIVDLRFDGQQVEVGGDVNERIELPGGVGFVILNEQVGSAEADRGDVTVSALHVVIPEVRDPITGLVTVPATDVVVARAHADIVCATKPTCAGPEKVTGGGWLQFDDARRNFALAGRQAEAWGHFLFIDHATRDKLQATQVDPITFTADGFAVLSGVARINGVDGHAFTAQVKDNGEPGRDDQFQLSVPSYPQLNQPLTTLRGGNIQFHKPCK